MSRPEPRVTVTFRAVPLGRLRELLELVRPLADRWSVSVEYRLEK